MDLERKKELDRKVFLFLIGVVLGGIFNCLILDSGWAIDWNMTNIYEINITENVALSTINAFYNPEFDKWYIQTNKKLARLDGDLTDPNFDYNFAYPKATQSCGEIQCSYFINSASGYNRSNCVTRGCLPTSSGGYGDYGWGYSTNPPFSVGWGSNPAGTINFIGISKIYDYRVEPTKLIRLTRHSGGSTIYWCDQPYGINCDPLGTSTYNGTLYVPSQYLPTSNEILFERIEGNYYFIFVSDTPTGTDQVYYTQYDSDLNNYGGVFRLSEFSAYEYSINRNPIFLHSNGEFLLTYIEKMGANNRSVIIDHYAETQDGYLSLLETERFDPPNVVDGTNQTILSGIARDNYRFWLFYQVSDGSSPYPVYAIAEDLECITGTWYNATGENKCAGDYQRQFRSVTPEDCDIEERFVNSTVCQLMNQQGITDPDELQLTKLETAQEVCYGGWVEAENEEVFSSFCSAELEISSRCTANINTTATYENEVEWITATENSQALENRNFNALSCHPMNNCFDIDYDCRSQYNISLPQETYNYYSPSETAQADFETYGNDCNQYFILWFNAHGWKRYRVKGTLKYTCDVECGGRNVCIKEGKLWYSIPENYACTLNYTAQEECELGEICIDGECISDIDVQDTDITEADNIFDWIRNNFEAVTPSWVQLVASVLISMGIGLLGYKEGGEKLGLVGVLGGAGIFFLIGWIPSIFAVLWIITIVWLLAQEYRKGVEK